MPCEEIEAYPEERNRDILLSTYAELMPEGLEELDPEQRRQIYALLRIELTIRRVGDLEIAGVLGADTSFRETEPALHRTTTFVEPPLPHPRPARRRRHRGG